MIALIASFLISTNATPRELVTSCRSMIPANVELSGRIILRNRKGIPQAEHDYVLTRSNAVTRLTIDGKTIDPPSSLFPLPSSLLNTDVTWSDLTLDYLEWNDFSFDENPESETVHGQVCHVILMKQGGRAVRVWIDRKTGALMQAEELKDGKAVRRLWGTRIRKFGERWMANVLEVETIGSGHRTKITVEELK